MGNGEETANRTHIEIRHTTVKILIDECKLSAHWQGNDHYLYDNTDLDSLLFLSHVFSHAMTEKETKANLNGPMDKSKFTYRFRVRENREQKRRGS